METIRIENIKGMQYGETKTFTCHYNGFEKPGFIIMGKDGVHAYLNKCQHWPVPLDMDDGDFYYAEIDRISCKSHGAVFMVENGYCDAGPCEGASLKKFETHPEGDDLLVVIPDPIAY